MTDVLALVEHDRTVVDDSTAHALRAACALVDARVASSVTAVVLGGADLDRLATELASQGASRVVGVHHPALGDYAPEAWGRAVAAMAERRGAAAVVAAATDRGNEVLAHTAAVSDLSFAANVVALGPRRGEELAVTRMRWGGSLLERCVLRGPVHILSVAPQVFADGSSVPSGHPATCATEVVDVALPETAARARVVDWVAARAGIDMTTAPVVVSGGRGVGSAEGFAVLEELAELLRGAVGCSRVATNNGWRPHRDQVGQTGKRVAPQLYIACGISGAIQHWVGMMAAARVLAVNVDPQANMVGRADYAVIGDLHEVIPAVVAEIRRRQAVATATRSEAT